MIKVTFKDEDGLDSAEFKTNELAQEFIDHNQERCEVNHLTSFEVISIEGENEE